MFKAFIFALCIVLPFTAFAGPVAAIALSAAVSGLAAASWTVFGAALVLGAISYAMTPKMRKPDAYTPNQNSTVAIRQSDLPRQIVYGHTRTVAGYAKIEETDSNENMHVVLMLCDGELRDIPEIWVDDYSIPADWIDAEGAVTQGRYANYMTIRKHMGSIFQEADPLLVTNLPEWTADHRLQGIAYLYVILKKSQDIYPNGVPNITAIVEGQTLYDPREGENVWTTNIALMAYDFIQAPTYGFAAFVDDVDLTNIAAQANICDEIVTVSEDEMNVTAVDATYDILTIEGDLLGLQYGDRVELASTGSLPGGISAATPYYVIPYQVGTTPRIKLASTFENAMAKVNIDITTAGSGIITIDRTGEPRYHGGGLIVSDTELSQSLNDIVSCMAGRAINVAGFWTLLAGAWRAPSPDFGVDDFRSQIRVQNCLSMSDSFNVVKGIFYSPLNFYQPSDYPAAYYTQFVANDNGIEAPKELPLPLCTRPTTAQRIAKIELFRGQQDITVNVDMAMQGIKVQTGDVVSLTLDAYGWEEKPFEVTEYVFKNNQGALTVGMTLRETAQAIYDWSAGEAVNFDPAPNSNLPSAFDVQVPSGVAYNSRIIDTVNGDEIYTLTLSWGLHPNAFVREFGDFELQFKVSSTTDWLPSFFVDGELTQTDVVNSSVNVPYDIRIRARNNLGVRSNWVTIEGAIAGSSGGVGSTDDWGSVAAGVTTSDDWGSVASGVTTDDDWGFVV